MTVRAGFALYPPGGSATISNCDHSFDCESNNGVPQAPSDCNPPGQGSGGNERYVPLPGDTPSDEEVADVRPGNLGTAVFQPEDSSEQSFYAEH
jgi:hypothetical protein